MASMIDRMVKAAKLNVDFYNEAEKDTSLTQEALLVVVLVSLLGGIGTTTFWEQFCRMRI